MKSYKRLTCIILVVFVCLWVAANFLLAQKNKTEDRPYMVEIARVATQMEEDGLGDSTGMSAWDESIAKANVEQYLQGRTYIKRIILCNTEEVLTAASPYNYCVRKIGEQLYRFEYEAVPSEKTGQGILNIIFGILFILMLTILLYIYKRIIRPFASLEDIPYELSKGNLTLQLPEEKAKYFGKFIWGTNMLRENIEERRQKELNLHREKKLLLLSLTHDIKTPLSVIKLNTQALERGLYKEEERQKEALSAIRGKVDEIEKYVSEITRASKEDFLDLQVGEEEFYLSKVIEHIRDYYTAKLELNKTQFFIEEYRDCLLRGDENRLVEVLQNLMENALKYGDGKEISIRFSEEEGCRLITVENSGTGLAKDELMKIFDSFYRGSNVKSQGGSGLGLYICRQLMSSMNGDIFVKQSDTHFQMTVVVRMCGV